MTGRYEDTCPACGSTDVLPWAVITGGSEAYGYQCRSCEVSWPVIRAGVSVPAMTAAAGHPAVAARVR